jgi:putative chitinase
MSLIKLQQKIGAKPDGSFGKETITKAAIFFNKPLDHMVHFFAQCGHETGKFKAFSENLNYSASGLLITFKSDFDINKNRIIEANEKIKANTLSRKPEPIANFVYANQNGNGNEASGDGWKFRGRGAIQLTGRANYQAFANSIKKTEIMSTPDIVADIYAFESAIYFFDKNKIWDMCKGGINDATILKISKRINGGTNGLDDRKALTYKYAQLIK